MNPPGIARFPPLAESGTIRAPGNCRTLKRAIRTATPENMKKRLFVVDDDPSVRESLKKVLAEAGYEVLSAGDGAEAQAMFDERPIDLLILDVNLPTRDGWDVLEDVTAKHPFLPIVMITGVYHQLDTTMIPGVRVFLKKPLEPPQLLSTVERVLAETVEERLSRMNAGLDRTDHAPPDGREQGDESLRLDR